MQVCSDYAAAAGATIYYETAGAGQPLIFVHGFGLDTRMWDDQFTLFAEKFFVIRYDLRGFGRSSVPGASAYAHHDDLKTLFDHLHISSAHVIGLSMGGRVAIDFAIAYPRCVSSLVLADSGLNGYKNREALFGSIFEKAPSAGATGANLLWLQHPLFAPAMRQPAVAKRLREMVHDYSGWHWTNADPAQWLEPPAMQQLDLIHARTLVISGEEDLPDYRDMADILAKHIVGAAFINIPRAGHMSNMEAPVAFNGAVLDFL